MALPNQNELGGASITTSQFRTRIEAFLDFVRNLSFSNLSGKASASQIPNLEDLNGTLGPDKIDWSVVAPWSMITWHWVDLSEPDPVPGWLLCDGSNGTPPILGRVPIGAGGSYNVGDVGGANTKTTAVDGGMTINGTSLSKSQGHIHKHGLQGQLITWSGDTEGSSGRYSRSGSHTESDTPILNSPGGDAHKHSASVDVRQPYIALAPFIRADYIAYINANGGI